VALVLRDGGTPAETPREARVRATVYTSLEPEEHRFGEPVTARVELVVRKAELDPETIRAGSGFEPYEVVGPSVREISEFGALNHVRYTLQLRCLKRPCLPDAETGEFQFGPGGFSWKIPAPPGRKFRDRRLDNRGASGSWPIVRVSSRLTRQDVDEVRWRSNLGDLPSPTFRVAPRWLAAGLLGGAVALVLAAAALVAGYVRREVERRRRPVEDLEAPAAPLAQALALVAESRGNGDVALERAALETLARELRVEGANGLASDAERLAWSERPPADGEVDALTANVRKSVVGEAT
jgi:hypothetical protein